MTPLTPTARRRLLLRYADQLERTGQGAVPALERHLNAVYAASRRPQPGGPALEAPPPEEQECLEGPEPEPQGSPAALTPDAEAGGALVARETPGSPAAPALEPEPVAPSGPDWDPGDPQASWPWGDPRWAAAFQSLRVAAPTTTVEVTNLIPSPPVPDSAVPAAGVPGAAGAMPSAELAGTSSAPAAPQAAEPQPAQRQTAQRQRRLEAFAKEVRRSGRCDHPELEARLLPLQLEPALARGDSGSALVATVARARAQLAQLEPLTPAAPDTPVPLAVLQGLRSLRQLLRDALATFGRGLQGPLRRLMASQLRRSRWLEWQLQFSRRRSLDPSKTWPLAAAMLEALRVALDLWSSVVPSVAAAPEPAG